MSLLALLLGAAVLWDPPSFCAALQQLVHQPQLLEQFLPLEERVEALLLLQLFLLLLLLLDFCGNGFHRRTGRSRLQGDGLIQFVFIAYAFTIYLRLMLVNNLDNSVCFSYLDNERYLNLKWETSRIKMIRGVFIEANLNVVRLHWLRGVSQNMNHLSRVRFCLTPSCGHTWALHIHWQCLASLAARRTSSWGVVLVGVRLSPPLSPLVSLSSFWLPSAGLAPSAPPSDAAPAVVACTGRKVGFVHFLAYSEY